MRLFDKNRLQLARKSRIRSKVSGTPERPRLSVYKSLKQLYVQVIDDQSGNTLTYASSLDTELKDEVKALAPKEMAKKVGALAAKRCKEKNIEQVVFDRGGNKYHGVIKILADAIREGGLKF